MLRVFQVMSLRNFSRCPSVPPSEVTRAFEKREQRDCVDTAYLEAAIEAYVTSKQATRTVAPCRVFQVCPCAVVSDVRRKLSCSILFAGGGVVLASTTDENCPFSILSQSAPALCLPADACMRGASLVVVADMPSP